MKMKKTFVAILAFCLLAFTLAGCAAGTQGNGDTREITDVYGRTVTIPADVQTCAPSAAPRASSSMPEARISSSP